MSNVRLAAAVVLHRNGSLYWVRRADTVPFMPGFHAFPGGTSKKGESPEATALREVQEETGVTLDAAALRPAGHWITPPFSPIRFDTRFFLAEMPAGQETSLPAGGELAEGEWIEPMQAIERWEAGRALMAPPVLHLLRACASSRDPSAWIAAATSGAEANGGEVRRIEMRRGVVLVPLRTPTLPPATHTNCYVVGAGPAPVIVDPGADDENEARALENVLAALSREGRKPSRIAITHHHHDHVGGVERLRRALGIPVLAHPATRTALAERGITVTETATDGAALSTGEGAAPVRVHFTPGHARGHLAFVEEGTRSLLSGDLILGLGTTIVDPPDGDMEDYMRSLEKLAGMPLASLFPGHGPVISRALDKIREYQAHREQREAQVLSALAGSVERTAEEIVAIVYTDVAPELHAFAARSVLAHLEWLERRGDVARRGARWQARTHT